MAQKAEQIRVRTPVFRAAFVNITQARRYDEDDPASKLFYEVVMLFPKATDLSDMRAAVRRCAQAKWPGGKPKNFRDPFKDGNDETHRDYEGFRDTVPVRATSQKRPGLTGKDGDIDREEFYSGCWGIATVVPYAYENKGNRGVSFGLRNIIKMRDDTPLSGGPSAEEEFSDIRGGASSAKASAKEEDDGWGDEGGDDDGEDGLKW